MHGYVYGLVDPRRLHSIRYVGFTTRSLEVRLDAHVYSSQARQTPVHHWICNLQGCGLRPVILELESIDDRADACNAERRWILRLRSATLLNVTNGGNGLAPNQSEEARAKLSAAAKQRRHSPMTKAKMSAAHVGHPVSPDTRERIRAAHVGRKVDPSVGRKISIALTGRKLPPETTAKMSAARKGKPCPPDPEGKRKWTPKRHAQHVESMQRHWSDPVYKATTAAKISAATKGRAPTPETRRRLSEGQLRRWSRPMAPETRARLSASVKRSWALRKK